MQKERKERKRWNGDEQSKGRPTLGLVRDQKIKEDTFGIYYQKKATNRRFFFGLKCKVD